MSDARIRSAISEKSTASPTGITAHEFMESVFTDVMGDATLKADGVREHKNLHTAAENSLAKIAAQNLLLYLERSVKLMSGQGYDDALNLTKRALSQQRNPTFISALLDQYCLILQTMSNKLAADQVFTDGNEEEKIRILIGCLVAFLPTLEPTDGFTVHIPMRINRQWQSIKYSASKIDISPTSGPLAWLIEKEDRLYDYILAPQGNYAGEVPNIIAIMGTPPPMIRGSRLAVLQNNKPHHSLGEGHNLDAIGKAMTRNDRQNYIVGHSQGAVMGMIVTAKYHQWVERADCLNPSALCESTLQRYKYITPAVWSKVNIYEQLGDMVFSLEKGFPRGINIHGIIDPHFKDAVAQVSVMNRSVGSQDNFDVHIRYLVAHRHAKVIPLDAEAENYSRERELYNDLKETMNKIRYVTRYISFCERILARKAVRALGMTQKMEVISQSVPGEVVDAIDSGINFASTATSTVFAILPLVLTGLYSLLKIMGNSIFTNNYTYVPSSQASIPADDKPSHNAQPKKWDRNKLPTNLNFKEKAQEARKNLPSQYFGTSVFGMWTPKELDSVLKPSMTHPSESKTRYTQGYPG